MLIMPIVLHLRTECEAIASIRWSVLSLHDAQQAQRSVHGPSPGHGLASHSHRVTEPRAESRTHMAFPKMTTSRRSRCPCMASKSGNDFRKHGQSNMKCMKRSSKSSTAFIHSLAFRIPLTSQVSQGICCLLAGAHSHAEAHGVPPHLRTDAMSLYLSKPL